MVEKTDYDVVVLGGGLAGCSLALRLLAELSTENPNISIAVLEKKHYQPSSQNNFDSRCIALSYGSYQILQSAGVWQALCAQQPSVVEPIHQIHIAEQGKFGRTLLKHQDFQLPALGYVVESAALGNTLLQQIEKEQRVDWLSPVQLEKIEQHEDRIDVILQDKDKIRCQLLVAADGDHSFCHQLLGSPPQLKKYQQTAIIANITTEYPHQNIAYERFTPNGPIALLPLTQNRCSLVWSVAQKDADRILQLDDQAFIEQLQQNAGFRLGKILSLGKRAAFPLVLRQLPDEVGQLPRIVFVGNAAHTIHPVAGQGLNLGLRDIDVLSAMIKQNIEQNQGCFVYHDDLIKNYWQQRKEDIQRVSRATDGLISIFANDLFPLTPLRSLSLALLDGLSGVKSMVAKQAMGIGL